MPPRNPSISLPGRKMPTFRTETLQGVEFVPEFPDGLQLMVQRLVLGVAGRGSRPRPALLEYKTD